MANRNVEALEAALNIGDVVGVNYLSIQTDGHIHRVGDACNSKAFMGFSGVGADTTLATPEAYYKVTGTYVSSGLVRFSATSAGVLTYEGLGDCCLFNGTADMQVDKVCDITVALYLNGALVTAAQSPHSFTAASKTSNLAITSLTSLATNDYLEVYAKSSVAATELTVKTLAVTFWGA